ncbi:MAG: energy transducer TonB [Bacteroidaceae bacterium]|nr:energy transducer TonB [Bacteroidaceae bacterium]
MKQFEDIFKERLEGYEMKLPASDRDAFLNRKATRERYARRRRTYINIAVGIPAAAAIIMGIMLSISLLSKQEGAPSEQPLIADVPKTESPAPITVDDADIEEDIMASTEGVIDDIWVEFIDDDLEYITREQMPDENEVSMVVEDAPEFPGGTNALLEYLRKNMIYPDSCRDNNIQGRVIVTFIVEKDGSITGPVVVKSVNRLFDAEALRLVSNMPKWKPGKQKGEVCRVKYSIPINFRL